MDLRHMRYFVKLCECGNLSSAARELFVTPQAISKSIKLLENEFQMELFSRQKSGLKITEFGGILYDECVDILYRYSQMEEKLKRHTVGLNKLSKISLSQGLMMADFVDYITEYSNANLQNKIAFMELPDLLAEQYIFDGLCDFGFTIGPPPAREDIEAVFLQHYKLCIVVNKSHILADKNIITLKECSPHPLITKNHLYKVHGIIEKAAQNQGLTLTYALESPNEILWRKLIEQNKGIGIGTLFYSDYMATSDLVQIPFSDEELNWDIYLIKKKTSYSPSIKNLMKNILDIFSKPQLF